VNGAADGAGDEDVTPSRIAASIRSALRSPEVASEPEVRLLLSQALDAVADGMPADSAAMLLYAALDRLTRGAQGA
jgi:hypothetical protein